MKKFPFPNIRFINLVWFAGCFLLGFLVCILFGLQRVPHKDIVGTLSAPVQSVFQSIGNSVDDFFASFTQYAKVRDENEKLRKELNELKIKNEESHYLEYENEQLRKLLALQEQFPSFTYAEADVVSRSTDGWHAYISLNRGSASGIEAGDIVVTGDGLVGVVADVGLNWSTVTCLVDVQLSVGALIVRTGEACFTEGSVDMRAQGKLMVSPLETSSLVNRGDTVITSGYGGRFPRGLVIGTVSNLIPQADGLSLAAEITPAVDFLHVRNVYVITNFDQEDILK